jgi:hypothetical protein
LSEHNGTLIDILMGNGIAKGQKVPFLELPDQLELRRRLALRAGRHLFIVTTDPAARAHRLPIGAWPMNRLTPIIKDTQGN